MKQGLAFLKKETVESFVDMILDEAAELEEGGKCTGQPKGTSTAKGKYMKCIKNPDGKGYIRKHWGQKGARATRRLKEIIFRARRRLSILLELQRNLHVTIGRSNYEAANGKLADLLRNEKIAVGQCYPFANRMATKWSNDHIGDDGVHPDIDDKNKFKVVHGKVTDKFSGRVIITLGIEMGDVVFDDQTKHTSLTGFRRRIL